MGRGINYLTRCCFSYSFLLVSKADVLAESGQVRCAFEQSVVLGSILRLAAPCYEHTFADTQNLFGHNPFTQSIHGVSHKRASQSYHLV